MLGRMAFMASCITEEMLTSNAVVYGVSSLQSSRDIGRVRNSGPPALPIFRPPFFVAVGSDRALNCESNIWPQKLTMTSSLMFSFPALRLTICAVAVFTFISTR